VTETFQRSCEITEAPGTACECGFREVVGSTIRCVTPGHWCSGVGNLGCRYRDQCRWGSGESLPGNRRKWRSDCRELPINC